jgi:ribosomal protein S18 acetylase RimI-like enzyme
MLVLGDPTDEDVRAAIRVRPTVELSKCYVVPGHHGAGVAATLMSETLREASLTGAAAVWLGVNQLNARAQRFYGKHGFERVGAKRFLVGDRYEDDWVMERPLRESDASTAASEHPVQDAVARDAVSLRRP